MSEGGTQRTTGEVLRSVLAALDAVDHVARDAASHSERLEWVGLARDVRRRVDGLAAALVAEADAAGSSTAVAGTPMTSWLALDGRTSAKEASARVFEAKDVAALPGVREAALTGTIEVAQARAITKVMSDLPQDLSSEQKSTAESFLLKKAATTPAREIGRLRRAALALVRPESDETREGEMQRLDEQRRRSVARRSLRFDDDGDGSITFRGSLPYVEAAPFQRLVDAYVESDRRRRRDDQAEDVRFMSERRADALVSIVTTHADGAGAPAVAGDRPRVTVIMREADLHGRVEQAGLLPGGAQISAGELRRILCDAELVPAVLGTASEVLDVGRSQRLVTPAIRRALTIRDGGCVFPSCDAEDWRCEAHHVIPWWDGGRTSLDNLALVCPHHHGLVEPPRFFSGAPPDRWRIRMVAGGLPEVIPPGGLTGNGEAASIAARGHAAAGVRGATDPPDPQRPRPAPPWPDFENPGPPPVWAATG